MALFQVRGGLGKSLKHLVSYSFSMNPFRDTWKHFGRNSMTFMKFEHPQNHMYELQFPKDWPLALAQMGGQIAGPGYTDLPPLGLRSKNKVFERPG